MATNNAINNTGTPLSSGSTLTAATDIITLGGNISLPNTNAAGTQGVITFNGTQWIHDLGIANVFVGSGTGALTLNTGAAAANTVVGDLAAQALDTGASNTGLGYATFQALTTGSANVAVGTNCLQNMLTGSSNICIGSGTGSALVGAEGSNIYINNAGVAAESHVIRIGTSGSGVAQQNKAFLAGVYGITNGATAGVMLVDSTDQLSGISGTSSQVLIGGTKPAWGAVTLTTQVTGVLPVANGGTGIAAITAHDLIIGNGTSAATLLAPSSTSGIPLVSQGASADPAYSTAVVAGGGTGNTTFTAYSVICAGTTATGAFQNVSGLGSSGNVLTSNGAGALPSWQAASGGGITTLAGDSGTATGSTVTIAGGSNITTSASSATVTVDLDNSPSVSGSVTAGTGFVATTGDITLTDATGGNINLSRCLSSSTGSIYSQDYTSGAWQVSRFMHNYGADVSGNKYGGNTFVGLGAGNFTLTQGTARFNTGVGTGLATSTPAGPLRSLTTGAANTAMGYQCLPALTSGGGNTAIGGNGLRQLTTGSGNLAMGQVVGVDGPGAAYTGAESNNICLMAQGTNGESNTLHIGDSTGTGAGQLNAAYICGINGITVTGTAVLVSSSDQLGIAVSSRRFKENIHDMSDYSSDIYKLRPVTFNYTVGDDHSLQSGLIAEEVASVMPALVVNDKEGLPQTVKYHDLPALLLNEIQKLSKRVQALEELLTLVDK